VIDYHRVKVMKELADMETGHFVPSQQEPGWTEAHYRKSAERRLKHIDRVAVAFMELEVEEVMATSPSFRQAA